MGLWSLESWFESKPASHAERCPSGLRRTLGKRVLGKRNRVFESPPLRHIFRNAHPLILLTSCYNRGTISIVIDRHFGRSKPNADPHDQHSHKSLKRQNWAMDSRFRRRLAVR